MPSVVSCTCGARIKLPEDHRPVPSFAAHAARPRSSRRRGPDHTLGWPIRDAGRQSARSASRPIDADEAVLVVPELRPGASS